MAGLSNLVEVPGKVEQFQAFAGHRPALAGACENGLWFYAPTLGYAFTSSDMGGWYQSLSQGYGRFLGP